MFDPILASTQLALDDGFHSKRPSQGNVVSSCKRHHRNGRERFEHFIDPEPRAVTLVQGLAEQEGDFDADSRFAIAWFDQHGFTEGEFGVADVLARAKVTSVSGLAEAGILESKRGRVRLLQSSELPADWDPTNDARLTHWEIVHHLIRVLESGGESAAAQLVRKLNGKAETARELAYRLYSICERKKRATEALAYNGLVQSWPEIERLARVEPAAAKPEQHVMFGKEKE